MLKSPFDDPHPSDAEWDALTCDICGAQPVTLCAGSCHHYCEEHGPDDDGGQHV